MARITVEDCLKNVKNRFELVMLAAKRARQLMHGAPPKVEADNDKATVIALREIAAGFTDFNTPIIEEAELNLPSTITITETITIHTEARPSEDAPQD